MKLRSQSPLPAAREQSLAELGRLRAKLLVNQTLPAALDDLAGMAEHHARSWLLGTKQQLDLVFFAMMPGEVELWAVTNYPGRFARDSLLGNLRRRMRERGVIAYSHVTEVWGVEPAPEEAQQGGYLPENRPSLRPDREEYVTALATDGFNTRMAGWKIRRDYKGAVKALDDIGPIESDTGPWANLLGGQA